MRATTASRRLASTSLGSICTDATPSGACTGSISSAAWCWYMT
ncbi:hypothetical protein DZC30_12020 [Comamonas testosteroni]|uniref:Uncharacterized protein n=1 Tax=Comamonas testosteroni TaxID=285 RepID=A0A373FNG0_COMTE|nr:hypothetical protein DZC30_12020 [Comamonas testosteroni]